MKRFALLVLVYAAVVAHADQKAEPRPLLFTPAEGGPVVFAMVPGAFPRVMGDSFGIAYRLAADGRMEELYRTSGWFSFRVYVSVDGRYLVRLEDTQDGHDPNSGHVALEFYESGRLLKRYTTLELVKDQSKLNHSKSHYSWVAFPIGPGLTALEPRLDYDRFVLTTVDGLTYDFDTFSGRIRSTTRQSGEPGATDNPGDAQRLREDH